MKPNKTAYAMIRTAAEKGIKDIQQNPERGVRNLVELGDMFSSGRYQRDFFNTAQTQLSDEHNVYYKVVERIVRETDPAHLVTFGMNLGYYCWTYGASHIRETEALAGFNIPWCMLFALSDVGTLRHSAIDALIADGKELGIYCYVFNLDKNRHMLPGLLDVIAKHGECAFVLLLHPELVDRDLVTDVLKMKTLFIAINLHDPDTERASDAASLLREGRCLYGGFFRYNEYKECSEYLQKAGELELPFLFLMQNEGKHRLYVEGEKGIVQTRENLTVPVFPIDLFSDIARIDRNISSQACLAFVSKDGKLSVANMEDQAAVSGIDIEQQPLREILKKALPK